MGSYRAKIRVPSGTIIALKGGIIILLRRQSLLLQDGVWDFACCLRSVAKAHGPRCRSTHILNSESQRSPYCLPEGTQASCSILRTTSLRMQRQTEVVCKFRMQCSGGNLRGRVCMSFPAKQEKGRTPRIICTDLKFL